MPDIRDIRSPGPNLQPGNLLWFILPAIAIIATITCFYTIQPEEEGVVLRFGKYLKTTKSGLNFKLPLGIDSVTKVPVKRQLKQEFGYGTAGATNVSQIRNDFDAVKTMVTGDTNAALVEWVIQYRITEPRQYLFNVRNPNETLRYSSESVMREVVGDRTVDEVLTVGRQEIESEALSKLQGLVSKFELGVTIDQVQLQNVNPPREVQASFNEVNEAEQQQKESVNVANGEYNKVVPRSRGEAAQKISEAEGYAMQRINEAEGDAARFDALFTQYQKAPEVTRQRLYLETMARVIPQLGRKIIMDEGAQAPLPLLNLESAAAAAAHKR
jgi:membrane protease subunit HflK